MTDLNDAVIIYFSSFPIDFPYNWTKQNAFELAKRTTVIYEYFHHQRSSFLSRILRTFNKARSFNKWEPIAFHPIIELPARRLAKYAYYLQLLFFGLILQLVHRKRTFILWFAYPMDDFELILKIFKRRVVVYDCTDHFPSLGNTENSIQIQRLEKKMLLHADYIFANSPVLYERLCKILPNKKQKMFTVPAGYVLHNYVSGPQQRAKYPLKIKKPIVGMIGSVSDRIDFDLYYQIIKLNPDISFVFLGQEYKTSQVFQLTNIDVKRALARLGRLNNYYEFLNIPFDKLGGYIETFDVAIIPYRTNITFNNYSNPIKIYIYFALKKPVVSTPIKITKYFKKYIKTAGTASSFSSQIRTLLKRHESNTLKKEKYDLAEASDIGAKIALIQHIFKQN